MEMAGDLAGGADDRVMATAQQIVKSLNTSKNVREDMLLILSSFDNRLSNISDLINNESNSIQSRLDAAEKTILRREDSLSSRHSDDLDDQTGYLTTIDDLLDLLDNIPDPEIIDRAENTLQIAMARLEEDFRHLLIRNQVPLDVEGLYGSIRRVSLSLSLSMSIGNEGEEDFNSFRDDSESPSYHERSASLVDNLHIDLLSAESIGELKEIADRFIRSGYEKECVQVYTSVRKAAHDECLVHLGVEKLSIEEILKLDDKILDEKMKRWIKAMKFSVRVLLNGEKRLCDELFTTSEAAREVCFNEIAKWTIMPLLNFGQAVAIVKRSAEKLFKILDMYDALSELVPDMETLIGDAVLLSEARGVLDSLGNASRGTFAEFEKNLRNESSKQRSVSCDIHPLTRYVMNYVKFAVDYVDTLNGLLENHEGCESASDTPMGKRLVEILSTLEANLDEKAKVSEDGGMQCIFLVNNILYIVQKVKDSELINILGDQWVKKRRGQIRQYAKAYLRATWGRALTCLKDDGISLSSGNAMKAVLKEKFKSFNACVEDVYRVQTGWKVPDTQLRDELRISISDLLIPAYRAFVGRYGGVLESGRHSGKYVKYTTEDLENYLSDLFEGVAQVLHHPRRKGT